MFPLSHLALIYKGWRLLLQSWLETPGSSSSQAAHIFNSGDLHLLSCVSKGGGGPGHVPVVWVGGLGGTSLRSVSAAQLPWHKSSSLSAVLPDALKTEIETEKNFFHLLQCPTSFKLCNHSRAAWGKSPLSTEHDVPLLAVFRAWVPWLSSLALHLPTVF